METILIQVSIDMMMHGEIFWLGNGILISDGMPLVTASYEGAFFNMLHTIRKLFKRFEYDIASYS